MTDYLKLAREARARADAATPAPWAYRTDATNTHFTTWLSQDRSYPGERLASEIKHQDDALFIARAREDVPALCDAIEAQAAEIAKWKEAAQYNADTAKAHADEAREQAAEISTLDRLRHTQVCELSEQAAEIERLRAYIKLLENSHT